MIVKIIETGETAEVRSMYSFKVSSQGNRYGYRYTDSFAEADLVVVETGEDFPPIRQYKQEEVTLP
jgi:hypothetical protein